MTDTQKPTAEQKKAYIFEALIKSGFERVNEMEIFTKEHDGKRIIVADLTAGKSVVFKEGTTRISTDDEEGTLLKVSKIITDAEDGRMPTKSTPDEVVHVPKKDEPAQAHTPESNEPEVFNPPEPAPQPTDTGNVPVVLGTPHALTQQAMPELSIEIIKKYINDKATDEEAYVFLELCKARRLNPFLKEAYLVKYDHTKPASMVVGKDAFMKRAESHPQYDGFEAGIIVEHDNPDGFAVVDERDGTYYNKDEKNHITGGWAKVYRKDQTHPVVAKVAFSEYVGINGQTGQPNRTWGSKPATMIRKVALVQALREAFPSELSGMYDQSEMGVEVQS